ncbi:MAG: hypothetical protein IKU58_00445 [Clostridia bacterium]|nr:hypothetical protein [Clostridia bacterium]
MLRYVEVALSHREIPDETALCIYISGCPNHCKDCHYPELQCADIGDILWDYFPDILDLYSLQATCVCFMGEGAAGDAEIAELRALAALARNEGFKVAVYSGRDVEIEPWMSCFDYVKVGSYQKDLGALDQPTTNQRLYKQTRHGFDDLTAVFWDREDTNGIV